MTHRKGAHIMQWVWQVSIFTLLASPARSLLHRQTVHSLHQNALIRKGSQPPTPSSEDVREQKDLTQAYSVKAILCFTRKETDSPMLTRAQNSAVLRAVPDLRRLALRLSIWCCPQLHHIKWEAISLHCLYSIPPTTELGQAKSSTGAIFSHCFIHCRHSFWFLFSMWLFNTAF